MTSPSTPTASPTASAAPGRGIVDFLRSPLGRLVLLLFFWLLLRIPLSMIQDLVQERQSRRNEAGTEVTSKWGGEQQLIGPILRVPYIAHYTDTDGKPYQLRRAAYLLPELLGIEAKLKTEDRHRGIFSFPVYGAELKLSGRFRRPDLATWVDSGDELLWQQAELQIGLSDVRAIHADGQLIWAEKPYELQPATDSDWNAAGVHVSLAAAPGRPDVFDENGVADFTLKLSFNGSDQILMAPVGRNTNASLQADWPHPSFQGAWLPTRSEVSAEQFAADWSISYLGRGYPQQWNSTSERKLEDLRQQLFGVSLLTPVDAYRMAERVTKYAALALFFTFLTIWLTELLSGRRVHPLHYLLVGSALCLFGLLQLAFGEHVGFAPGFLVSTLAVTGMVTFYSRAALQGWRAALIVGGLLSGLYGYLYLLLQAEDYALLGGSVALFAGLAAVMLLTRKLDWHQLGGG
jgi:inner membrane protein